MCIIVGVWKLKFQRRNADAIGLQKMEKNLVAKELKQIWNSAVVVAVAVANMITSIPMETILNTHNFITCCVHLHIDTNNIWIYTQQEPKEQEDHDMDIDVPPAPTTSLASEDLMQQLLSEVRTLSV